MTTESDLIAARLETLPITHGERSGALAYVSAGEALAGIFLKMANWLEASRTSPALKPSYQD